jgi:hypothetical protein
LGTSSLLEEESESEESDDDDSEEDEEEEEEEEEEDEDEDEDSCFDFLAGGAALDGALVAGAAALAGSAFLVNTTCLPLDGGGASLELLLLLLLLLESDSSLLESSEEDSTFLAGFLATSLDFAIAISFLEICAVAASLGCRALCGCRCKRSHRDGT